MIAGHWSSALHDSRQPLHPRIFALVSARGAALGRVGSHIESGRTQVPLGAWPWTSPPDPEWNAALRLRC